MAEQFESLELELARQKVIRADYSLLDAYYQLTIAGPEAIATAAIAQGVNVDRVTLERNLANFTTLLASHRPQLKSILEELDKIIDLLDENAVLDENTMKARLMNILELLKQVGEYMSVTGKYITQPNIGWSLDSPPTQQHWTDDNLLKEAYDLISELIERI